MRRKRKHLKKGPICQNTVTFARQTMFGPNRPAADMEGNGEFNFGGFLRIFEEFLRNFGEIGSLLKKKKKKKMMMMKKKKKKIKNFQKQRPDKFVSIRPVGFDTGKKFMPSYTINTFLV